MRRCAVAREIFLIPCVLLIVVNVANARTQVTISVSSTTDVTVELKLSTPSRSWSFRNAFAGVLGVAARIHDLHATTTSGDPAVPMKITTGEFRSDVDMTRIVYTVRISEVLPSDVPHISWMSRDHALLMLADLLPQDVRNASVEFVLPSGWTVESSVGPRDRRYDVDAPEKAVFFVGSSVRKTSTTVEGMPLEVVLSGTWSFRDERALKTAGKVMRRYLDLTGYRLTGTSTIMIAPLPVSVGSTKWRAETRGSTVVLLIDPAANFTNWIGQLGVIFTHEIFHLWVPNSLNLDGDYDWFFEGFTLYTALRTALDLKLINFKEFLDTLARVYDSYLSYADDSSLIDASERRWTTPGSLVYDKGMLVGFVYDLLLRKESGGKATLAERYRQLFSSARAEREDGNEAIIAWLGSSPAAKEFARVYIESSTKLELERLLQTYGLMLDSSGTSSQLRVSREPNSDQKRLLRSLGYRD